MTRLESAARDWFWAKVDVRGPDECWLWTGCVCRLGYGVLTVAGKRWKAHRFAVVVHSGVHPGQRHVRHRCDVAQCVNPAHLELGSHQDNMRDRSLRGRTARGASVGNSVLTEGAVESIRILAATGLTWAEISRRTGHPTSTVRSAANGGHWWASAPRPAAWVAWLAAGSPRCEPPGVAAARATGLSQSRVSQLRRGGMSYEEISARGPT